MLEKFVKDHYQKSLKDCSNEEIYIALLEHDIKGCAETN